MKIYNILLWSPLDSYFTYKNWRSGTSFNNDNAEFIFTDDKKRINDCDIVIFSFGNYKNKTISELNILEKKKNQSWFVISSEIRFELHLEEIETLRKKGIDKFLYDSYNGDYFINRGLSREYFGKIGENYCYEMLFKKNLLNKKKKLCIIYAYDPDFNDLGNINNIPYKFPYKSRGDYLKEIIKHFPYESYGKWKRTKKLDSHKFSINNWENKLNIIENYMFTSAIENNLEDAFTEKIFQAYYSCSIPIVSTKNNDLLPKKSFISIHDFDSAFHLAKYLHEVANNEKLFEEYFEWKKDSELLKKENPKFYELVITISLPCFLENLHCKNNVHECNENCMKKYNEYYKKYLLD